MKNDSKKIFTASGGDPETLSAENRTYTESDNRDKSKKVIIRIWPYLPSHSSNNSANSPSSSI
ncbi:MAG: hypothetical protein FWF22_01640 [Treponema sp.]|nr:hypothetical protein [Treponema sp.]